MFVQKSIKAIRKLAEKVKEGKSVKEIISGSLPKEIQELQNIETQMAIVSVIEKLGYTYVTKEILLEQLSSERIGLLNVVGTKALTSILQSTSYTAEEIMTFFLPEDFKAMKVKERVTQILNIAQEMNQAQVDQCKKKLWCLTIDVHRFIFQREI